MDATLGEIIVAAITAGSAIGVAIVGLMKARKERDSCSNQLEQAEKEITFSRATLDFPKFVTEWGTMLSEVNMLMDETVVDRFIIFRAWNGKHSPRWTTGIYQIQRSNRAPVAYVHFELDDDYVSRISQIIEGRSIYFTTDELPESRIKSVYKAEGVTAAFWVFVDAKEDKDGGKSITYCSFCTHEPIGINPEVQNRCDAIAGRLSGVSAQFT